MANPNPSPSTRFGAENGNQIAGGKTSEQRKAEYAAAEKSAILRDRALSYIMEKAKAGEMTDETLELLLNPSSLKLFKDSEDRAHGLPKQSLDVESPQGTMTPKLVEFVSPQVDDESDG